MKNIRIGLCAAAVAMMLVAGCKSAHLDITVENRTGAEIRLLEVDYPSASFGADRVAPGGAMHYRVALQGNGPVKVQYTGAGNVPRQASGPELAEGESGSLAIDLLPEGKAEFHPLLRAAK